MPIERILQQYYHLQKRRHRKLFKRIDSKNININQDTYDPEFFDKCRKNYNSRKNEGIGLMTIDAEMAGPYT